MTKAKKCDIHGTLLAIAKQEIKRHIETVDGEKCFNIFAYLGDLEWKFAEIFDGDVYALGGFELNANRVARYVWTCLTLEEGEQPYGTTFRGMPTLD